MLMFASQSAKGTSNDVTLSMEQVDTVPCSGWFKCSGGCSMDENRFETQTQFASAGWAEGLLEAADSGFIRLAFDSRISNAARQNRISFGSVAAQYSPLLSLTSCVSALDLTLKMAVLLACRSTCGLNWTSADPCDISGSSSRWTQAV